MFDEHEMNLIYQDQISILKSMHRGGTKCNGIKNCPGGHFDLDIHEVDDRKSIIKKILDLANSRG